MKRIRRFATSALLLCMAGQGAPAEASTPAWLRIAPDLASDAELPEQAQALLASPPSFGDADVPAEMLYEQGSFHLRDDGKVVERYVHVTGFVTDAGIQAAGNFSFPVRSHYSQARLLAAFTLLPNGRRVAAAPDTIQTVDLPARDIYSDSMSVVVPLPALQRGAIAVAVLEVVFEQQRWPLPWSQILFTADALPRRNAVYELSWDESVAEPLWRAPPGLECARNAPRRVRCSGSVESAPWDPDVPSAWDYSPHLIFSEPTSWDAIAAELLRLVADNARVDASIRATAARLVDGVDDPRARVERIHRFVADDVRYTGLEHGSASVVPHPASVTLERRYGDCKDKVALFVALARAAGVDAYPLLVSTGMFDEAHLALASWKYFDHMITCVDLAGKPLCIDPTAPLHPTGVLPVTIEGAVAMDLRNADLLRLSSAQFPVQVDVRSTTRVGCDSRIRETHVRRFGHGWGPLLKGQLAGLTPAERTHWAVQDFASNVTNRIEPSVRIQGLSSASEPLSIELELDFPGSGSVAQSTYYRESDPWIVAYASGLKARNQHYAHRVTGFRYAARHRYDICRRIEPSFLGPRLRLVTDQGKLLRKYERDGAEVVVTTVLRVDPGLRAPEEQARLNQFLDLAIEQSAILFWTRPR